MAIFLEVCFGKRVIFLWIVSSWFHCPARVLLLTVAFAGNIAEMVLEQKVLHIAIQNKIKACPCIKLELQTFAKINVLVVLISVLAVKNNILVLSLEPMNTFLSAALNSVFSHSCLVLLIIFPLISVSRRLCYISRDHLRIV